MRWAAVVVLSASVLVANAFAAPAATIEPTSIAGAKLGLRADAYKRLFGTPVQKGGPAFPKNYTRLVFTKRKVAVHFDPGGKAVEVSTWSASDKTAAGIGPCSSIHELEAAYGSKLKPSVPNTLGKRVYAYTVGKLLFAATGRDPKPRPSKHVTAVALYSGPLNTAGFLALQTQTSAVRCG